MYDLNTTKALLAGLPSGIRENEVKKMLKVIVGAANHYGMTVEVAADGKVKVNEEVRPTNTVAEKVL